MIAFGIVFCGVWLRWYAHTLSLIQTTFECRYNVRMFREFKHLIEWDTPEYLFGVIEMIVCSYARIFIGTKASTFSGYIQRFVCIQIDSLLFHFISFHFNLLHTYLWANHTIPLYLCSFELIHFYLFDLFHHLFLSLSLFSLRGYYPDTINPNIYFTDTKYLGEYQYNWGRPPMINGNQYVISNYQTYNSNSNNNNNNSSYRICLSIWRMIEFWCFDDWLDVRMQCIVICGHGSLMKHGISHVILIFLDLLWLRKTPHMLNYISIDQTQIRQEE